MTSKIKHKVAVLGGGSWGATLAQLLVTNGHDVNLWEYSAELAKKINDSRRLETLPDLVLDPLIRVTNDLGGALDDRNLIVSVTPSHGVRSTFTKAHAMGVLPEGALVVTASKGIENETFFTMNQIIEEVFPSCGEIVVLAGPSHAEEVALGQPVALVAASLAPEASLKVQDLFSRSNVRVYTSDDPIGVELGGALKNVYAVACGIVDGLKLGDNTKAALMTRGLLEMTKLGQKQGAQPITFFGLSGLGDLIVTCGSRHSRNRLLGEKIGAGKSLAQALSEMVMVAEGVNTTRSAYFLAKKLSVDAPIISEMYNVLFENKLPQDSIRDLLARPMGKEMEGLSV